MQPDINERLIDNLEPGGYMYFFEKGVPETITTTDDSALFITNEHSRDGTQSLAWSFKPYAGLIFSQDIGFLDSDDPITPFTFLTWIYCSEPNHEEITFNFGREESVNCSFNIKLNFVGWRGIAVPFRDMEGKAVEGMQYLTISVPDITGTILFDQVIMAIPVDNRWPTPDYLVPFINPGVNTGPNKNWMAILMYDQMLRSHYDNFNFNIELNDTSGDSAILYKNFDNYSGIQSDAVISQEKIDANLARYDEFQIRYNSDGTITGKPLDHPKRQNFMKVEGILSPDSLALLTDTINISVLGKALLETAKFLRTDSLSTLNRSLLEKVFIDGSKYAFEQGWENGSGYQIISHVGYQTRELFDSWFIGRKVLEKYQLLELAQQAMMWFSATGRIYETDDEIIDSNVDILNTQLQWMIKSFLLLPETSVQYSLLLQLQSWLSKTLLTSKGVGGGFKPDGAVFHHSQHYPAYGKDAFNGLAGAIYGLSNSVFKLSEAAHARSKDILLKMRIYTKETNIPVVLSGRHPDDKQKISPTPYKWMALAGSPDGSEPIDKELAAAYANLANKADFQGIPAENEPVGSWSINYASMVVQRGESKDTPEKSWLAVARGYSRYLVGNETYETENLYGRYLQYGHLDIIPAIYSRRAFSHDGWDWNRYPGTTTIHLPNDQLRAVLNQLAGAGIEEMLLSTETYAGATVLDNLSSMLAVKLHGHAKYEQQNFYACKSYFIFDNRVVALGTGISNDDSEHETATTLFQHTVPDGEVVEVNGEQINQTGTDVSFKEATTFMDPAGNRYFIPDGYNIRFLYDEQESNSQSDAAPTKGIFATALIEHGISPQNQSYEYAIVIEAGDSNIPEYTVVQADTNSHIVLDNATGKEGYAFFEPVEGLEHTLIIASDSPCMALAHKASMTKAYLSIVNPDLALYAGQDSDQIDENGQQVEVSIYSRPWRYNLSMEQTVSIIVAGNWQLDGDYLDVTVESDGVNTQLTVTTIDAKPVLITLVSM